MDNFIKIRSLIWKEVFALWKKSEVNNKDWVKMYQARGFNSWDEWRMTYVIPLLLNELNWSLYKIINPLKSIPNFLGGPFSTWIKKYYQGHKTMSFNKIIENESAINRVGGKVYRLINKFPKTTTLIGLEMEDKIIIIEGMHRCMAISMINKNGLAFNNKVNIILAKSKLRELPMVGQG